MKIFFRLIYFIVAAVLTVALLAALFGWLATRALLDEQPRVTQYESTSMQDLRRIKVMAIEFSRQTAPDAIKRVALSERDINLAIGHFVPRQARLPENTYFAVQLNATEQATVHATAQAKPLAQMLFSDYQHQLQAWMIPVTEKFIAASEGKWLNLEITLDVDGSAAQGKWLRVRQIKLGSVPLSTSLSRDIADRVLALLSARADLAPASASWRNLRGMAVDNAMLELAFVIPQQGVAGFGNIEALVLNPGEQELVEIYSRQLDSLPGSGALVAVLAPLFEFAAARSRQSADPVAENRALLLALARRYGGEQLLTMLESGQRRIPDAIPKPYTIYGRRDLAQHLVLSAGLSLIASQDLAELFGIEKELADTLRGRSISAWDLLADKAGVRLAENATLSARDALEVQKWFSRARRDRQLLPDLGEEFAYSEDSFGPDELGQLELMIELYLEQHPILRKRS